MLNFIIKKMVGAVFALMVLSVVLLVIISQPSIQNSFASLGIHIGTSDIIHPDHLIDSSLQKLEQDLSAEIN